MRDDVFEPGCNKGVRIDDRAKQVYDSLEQRGLRPTKK